MSHSAAIENQNIESSDIKKKKRKRLFLDWPHESPDSWYHLS